MNIGVNLQLGFKSSGEVGQIYVICARAGFLLQIILNGKSKVRPDPQPHPPPGSSHHMQIRFFVR